MELEVACLAQVEVTVGTEDVDLVALATSVGGVPFSLALACDLVMTFGFRVLALAFATLEHLLYLSNLLMTSLRMHAANA